MSSGHEQPCSANESVSESNSIPLQGAVEVLTFLKECIFSTDWHSSIFKEAYDPTLSKGCCSICARVCHMGHRVVYSRLSCFFCDCGVGGVRGTSCLSLKL